MHVDAGGLRLYGHPGLLAVAASINGDDFVPYNDAIFVKKARSGRIGRLASRRRDALGQPGVACRHPRLQLPGATSCNHCRDVVDRARQPSSRQGRHQGHGRRQRRQRHAPRRRPAGLRRWRCHDRQPPNRARLVRKQFSRPRVSITFGSTSEPPCSGSPASSGWPLLTPPIPSTTRERIRNASSNRPGCHRCPLSTPAGRGALRVPPVRQPRRRLPVRGRDDRSGRDELQPAHLAI